MPSCNQESLEIYIPSSDFAWDLTKVKHLFSRIGFGVNFEDSQQALLQNPSDVVNKIINDAIQKPLLPNHPAGNWLFNQFDPDEPFKQSYEFWVSYTGDWINHALNNPFREKMVLFWSNHLVTKFEAHGSFPFFQEYLTILQNHALGNFKTLVTEMGLSRAMLAFLNGWQNTKFEPNENYARELFELFTLGLDNGYTEFDIRETARAFTGYNTYNWDWGQISFNPNTFDNGIKTIFEQTGNFGYHDVVNILFEQRAEQIAYFIASKIYKYFISPDINADIVNQMATTFRNNNWEIAPMLREMFLSRHFFHPEAHNNIIKSHFEYFMQYLTLFGGSLTEDDKGGFFWYCSSLGQTLFDPTDVAGWKGDHAWLDSGSIVVRWLYTEWMIYGLYYEDDSNYVVPWIKNITGNSNDVEYVVRSVVDLFLVSGLRSLTDYDHFITVFKGDIPENYFEQGLWNLDWGSTKWQLWNLINAFKRSPDLYIW